MEKTELQPRIQSFGLPETFPAHLVPPEADQFVKNALGMTRAEAIELAERRGFMPMWEPLPRFGEGIHGLGLSVNGLLIPFTVQLGR